MLYSGGCAVRFLSFSTNPFCLRRDVNEVCRVTLKCKHLSLWFPSNGLQLDGAKAHAWLHLCVWRSALSTLYCNITKYKMFICRGILFLYLIDSYDVCILMFNFCIVRNHILIVCVCVCVVKLVGMHCMVFSLCCTSTDVRHKCTPITHKHAFTSLNMDNDRLLNN